MVSSFYNKSIAQLPKHDTATTYSLQEIIVRGEKHTVLPGFKQTKIDSLTLSENKFASLSEVLANHSPVFIKSYGQGSLATVAFRGTGARHTNINWNGIALNSPSLGMLDLSLVPVFFADAVGVVYGGGSLLYGSGGLGGSIQLNNAPNWNNKINIGINQRFGSFNDYKTNVQAKYGSQKWQGTTGIIYQRAKNDFPYKNVVKIGTPVERQKSAEIEQYHILQELYYKINSRNFLSARVWLLKNHRNIPPPLTSPNSYASLLNETSRSMLEWKRYFKNNGLFILRTFYMNNLTNYMDTVAAINSNNKTQSLKNQIRITQPLGKKIVLLTGADYDFELAQSDGYKTQQWQQRNTSSLFADFNIDGFPGATFNIHLRQVLIDQDLSPFLIAAGMKYRFHKLKPLALKANISRNFKAPTLHDLYWYPGGNPELKPEKGWTAEGGMAFSKNNVLKVLNLKTELTGFYSQVEDWIQWSPTESGYWQAQNLKEVLSRGIEGSLKFDFKLKSFKIEGMGMYSYVQSTNEKPISNADSSVGKQLIYVPLHSIQSYLRIRKKDFYFTYEYTYTGIRYITTDNSWHMPAYWLSNVVIGKGFKWNSMRVNVQFEVKNILDRQYQSIANRPMPGRYYGVSVSALFNKGK